MQARRLAKTALKHNREAKLQELWSKIDTGKAYLTADKQSLRIISPGTLNNESGPDFLNAKILLGERLLKGDIEAHIKTSDWFAHAHDSNPDYDNVILHVVEKDDDMENKLQIPIFLINDTVEKSNNPNASCPFFGNPPDNEKTGELLKKAGLVRFKSKTDAMAQEMLTNGSEKTFIKHIFKALGYKKNSDNFLEIFDRLSAYDLKELKKLNAIEAVLWGESNLLPETKKLEFSEEISAFQKKIWKKWWKIRKTARHKIEWKRSGTRPLNSPERRMAGLCSLMNKTDFAPLEFFRDLETYAKSPEKFNKLLKDTLVCSDKLWDNYANFMTKRKSPANVIGENRALELAVNAILPGLAANATLKKDKDSEIFFEEAWLLLPSGQENKLVKSAFKMWFPNKEFDRKTLLNSSAKIQGTIHVYKEYCHKNSSDCKACPIYRSAGLQ
jgi:hypothetical protein